MSPNFDYKNFFASFKGFNSKIRLVKKPKRSQSHYQSQDSQAADMSTMVEDEFITDAVPSPPRDKENVHIKEEKVQAEKIPSREKQNVNGKEEARAEQIPKDDDEFEPDNKSEEGPEPPFDFGNFSKDKRAVINITQISNAQYSHVGSNYYINCNMGETKKNKPPKQKIIETERMAELKKCDNPVTEKDINVVAEQIGKRYVETFVQLNFTSSYIEQQKLRFHDDVPGLIRWLLVDWIQNNGRSVAIVSALANALWNTRQYEAIRIWSEKYDEIHQ